MKIVKDVLKLVVLLSLLQLSVDGKPLTSGCSQISQIELYYPSDPGAENTCEQCLECPEGQGLTPQCGSKVSNDTRIECVQCQANVSYSNSKGIESCKACQVCGLKNVIRPCSPKKNAICGTKCPQRHFLDGNNICQECYFCCDSVSDAERRQGCIDIGMTRDWQCEKTRKNQRCYEDLKKVTTKKDKEQEHGAVSFRVVIGVVTTIFFIPALALVGLMITSKRVKQFCQFSRPNQRNLQEDDPESIPLNFICEHTDSGQASPQDVVTTEVSPLSRADNSLTNEEHDVECGEEVCEPNQADIPTDINLTTEEHEECGKEVCKPNQADIPADINLTTEEHEECGKEVCKPNLAAIPTDCRISEMAQLTDNEGSLMLFYVKKKLDALETSNRKTWRSVGQVFKVSSEDLDMIETEYMARRSPTESLLELLKNCEKEPAMKEFVEALIICGRHDLADVICNWPWAK